MVTRRRLDDLLIQRRLVPDLGRARALIGAGEVLVDERIVDKAGHLVRDDCRLDLKQRPPYVSRGGWKLERGLQYFDLDVRGYVCADIGCSTGGFTDCLLQHGARLVYCVDVGYGVLDWKLRTDERVIVRERTNARYLTVREIDRPLDLAVIDVSFISLTRLFEPLLPLFSRTVRLLVLVKPQFELKREQVTKGGVIRDPALHREAVTRVRHGAEAVGLTCHGVTASPVRGTKGNQEFLLYCSKQTNQ